MEGTNETQTKGNDRSHDPPTRLPRVGVRVRPVDETLGRRACWWAGCSWRHIRVEAVASRRS